MLDYTSTKYLLLAVYYASYLYFLAAPFLIWRAIVSRGFWRLLSIMVLLGLTLLAYARFVEPRILLTGRHEIALQRCVAGGAEARIAVFADTHYGVFRNATPLKRIVRRVEALDPDFVLVAGDWIYHLAPARFEATFAGLKDISAPVFGVRGNHDNAAPEAADPLYLDDVLQSIGVRMIDDDVEIVDVDGTAFEIVGLSDQRSENQNRALLVPAPTAPRIVLTHNPGSILEFGPNRKLDLMVAGHTHGGQIYIPFLTCKLVGRHACRVVRYGVGETERGPVFVTSGAGMVGLPMRFAVAAENRSPHRTRAILRRSGQ